MPQIVIHSYKILDNKIKKIIVDEIRESIFKVLNIDEKVGQVFLYETNDFERSIHRSRNKNLIFIEINMYIGRTKDIKEKLMSKIVEIVYKYTKVNIDDIICLINEIKPENYFGGISHKYIDEIKTKYNV